MVLSLLQQLLVASSKAANGILFAVCSDGQHSTAQHTRMVHMLSAAHVLICFVLEQIADTTLTLLSAGLVSGLGDQ
jgi:hypothetical protein